MGKATSYINKWGGQEADGSAALHELEGAESVQQSHRQQRLAEQRCVANHALEILSSTGSIRPAGGETLT